MQAHDAGCCRFRVQGTEGAPQARVACFSEERGATEDRTTRWHAHRCQSEARHGRGSKADALTQSGITDTTLFHAGSWIWDLLIRLRASCPMRRSIRRAFDLNIACRSRSGVLISIPSKCRCWYWLSDLSAPLLLQFSTAPRIPLSRGYLNRKVRTPGYLIQNLATPGFTSPI